MPKVGNKSFPYTAKGMKDAKKAAVAVKTAKQKKAKKK
jgi:hypothetical protein